MNTYNTFISALKVFNTNKTYSFLDRLEFFTQAKIEILYEKMNYIHLSINVELFSKKSSNIDVCKAKILEAFAYQLYCHNYCFY